MRLHLPRMAFVCLVFLLFLAHAAGLFRIEPGTASLPGISASWPATLDLLTSREFLLLAAIGLVLVLCLPLLEPIAASILTLACVIPPVYLNYGGYLDPAVLPMEYFLLIILILFGLNVLISYYSYSYQRRKIIDTFSHYVPPHVVRKLCREPGIVSLKGESRKLTVLFADLVDFSSLAEQFEPEELTAMLNEHFDVMSSVLLDHGATIDKYIGDAIMAFWGAPLAREDQADQAVHAAFALHQATSKLKAELDQRGLSANALSIGINSGLMHVGNIGSRHRTSYTVIGDAVNVAARLEELTRFYKVPIIISEAVAHGTTDIVCRRLDRVRVRGKQHPVDIYQPLATKSRIPIAWSATAKLHDKALAACLNGDYRRAGEQFQALLQDHPDDAYYAMMLERIENPDKRAGHPFAENPDRAS